VGKKAILINLHIRIRSREGGKGAYHHNITTKTLFLEEEKKKEKKDNLQRRGGVRESDRKILQNESEREKGKVRREIGGENPSVTRSPSERKRATHIISVSGKKRGKKEGT